MRTTIRCDGVTMNSEQTVPSPSSGLDLVHGAVRSIRNTVIKLVASALLLALVFGLEGVITSFLTLIVEERIAETLYLLVFGILSLSTSYYVYKAYVSLSAHLVEWLSAKPSIKPAMPLISLFNQVLGAIAALVAVLWLFSTKIPFFYGLVQGIITSFSGLFSILIALILATQVKEIAGNYIAGLIIKSSRLIGDQEFLNFGDQYLKVTKVDHSYTRLVDRFGEEVYIPNLRFLIDTFRKPFSKRTGMYIHLTFSLPYSYGQGEVSRKIVEIVEEHNKRREATVPSIEQHRLLLADLANYAVVYELQIRPATPTFPELLKSSIRELLRESFGKDLATPMLLDITREAENPHD